MYLKDIHSASTSLNNSSTNTFLKHKEFISQAHSDPSHWLGNVECLQDGGLLLYDPNQEVVDVLLQLCDLGGFLGQVSLLFDHQLDQLLGCQLAVRAAFPRLFELTETKTGKSFDSIAGEKCLNTYYKRQVYIYNMSQ